MTVPAVSFQLSARVVGGTVISAGQVVMPDNAGNYVVATSANRTALGRRSEAIATTSINQSLPGGVQLQEVGKLDASFGPGPGTAGWVRCSTTGAIERFTPSGGGSSDVIGWIETDGRVSLLFGLFTESIVTGGGGGATPGSPDKSLQYRVDASTFGGDAYWTRESAGRINGTYYDPIDGVTVRSIITFGNPSTGTYPAFGVIRVAKEIVTPGSVSLITYHDGVTGRAALGVSGGILFLGDTGLTNETQVYGSLVTIVGGGSSVVGGFTVSEIVLGSLTGSNGVASVASSGKIRRSLGSALQVLRTNAGATDVEWAAGFTAPTGTGLVKCTSGVLDAATSLLVNADVNASAAIAGTKISPDFGAQTVQTTGVISVGSTPSGTGTIRGTSALSIKARNNANSADLTVISKDSSDAVNVGDANVTSIAGTSATSIIGRTTTHYFQPTNGSADWVTIDATNGLWARTTFQIQQGATPATSGAVRLTNNTSIQWRNAANSANLNALTVDASDLLIVGNAGSLGTILKTDSGGSIYCRPGSNDRIIVSATGVSLHTNTPSLGGGTGVMFVANAGTVPSSNPTGGGILYAEAGAGKWRGSGGTITTFGPAEPHCPTCGRDFAVEHQNEIHGEHLALCLPCLVDALAGAGVDTSKFTIKDVRGSTKAQWDASPAEALARDAARAAEERAIELARIAAEQTP